MYTLEPNAVKRLNLKVKPAASTMLQEPTFSKLKPVWVLFFTLRSHVKKQAILECAPSFISF